MISFKVNRLFVADELVDMRKSYNTLSDLVTSEFKKDVYRGDAFVFLGKRKNLLKVLWWEDTGFWIFQKRLERGRFHYPFLKPVDCKERVLEISPLQWQMLLDGIIPLNVKKMKRFSGL